MKLMWDDEAASFEQVLDESGTKQYKIKGIFSSPGEKNKNGRIYPMHIWEKEVAKYQDVIKSGHPNSLCELEHPARTQVDMMEAVAKITKLYIENRKVMGEAVLLNNPKANQLKSLIDAGIKMSVSSRGVGTVNEGVVKDYKLITFDIIPNLGQSDHNAEMYGIVEGILEDKNFEITESGQINEIQVCTSNACHLFEKTDIQEGIKEKFSELLEALKATDGCIDKERFTLSKVTATFSYKDKITGEEKSKTQTFESIKSAQRYADLMNYKLEYTDGQGS